MKSLPGAPILIAFMLMAGTAKADTETAATVTLLTASELSLAVDMLQTLDIKRHPYHWESNPILGSHPSDATVMGYFGVAMAGTAILTYVLPKKWRLLAPILVLAIQIPMIRRNAADGVEIRF